MTKVPLLLLAAAASAAAPLASTDGSLLLTVPAGWTSVPAAKPALFRLEGPLQYSALISRLEPTQYLYNRAALSNSLESLLKRVASDARISLELDPKLRHAALANGAEVDYRVGRAPGRPAMLLGIGRFAGQVLLVQVISHHAEQHVREVLGALRVPAAPASPPGAGSRGPSMGRLLVLWAGSLLAILAAMGYWWRQLKRPSRKGLPRHG